MKLDSPLFNRIRVKPEVDARPRGGAPVCQWPECNLEGTHRAPKGRSREREYWRFCLDHVREYNHSYNYFAGMSDEAVARYQKDAVTGHRPTWKMGLAGASTRSSPDMAQMRSGRAGYYNRMRDPFDLFKGPKDPREARERKAKPLEAKALETLGLDTKATGKDIKARYKELVKRHHPDANGGDRGSEDRFRDVLQAYRVLKQAGLC